MHRALSGRASFDAALQEHGIEFIVTMNSMTYRKCFAGSLLARLYAHDLEQPVGARLEFTGGTLEKLISNPLFDREESYDLKAWPGLNHGTHLRVIGAQDSPWRGHHPLWNSVYRVLRD